jgi:hypothetical protein
MQNHTDQAEASTPTENGSNINRTVAERRKAAKRSNPFDLTAEELHLVPQEAEDLPARKKARLEEAFPTTTDEAAGKAVAPDVSVRLPPAAAGNDDANADLVTDTQPNARATTVTRRRWTSEEDAKLTSAVTNTPMKKWGKEYKINWDTIAALIPGRTGTQCREKWNHVLDHNIVRATGCKGRWTADEDKKLKETVQTHGGKDWAAVAALVPSRTKSQCQNRWYRVLDPSITLTNGRTGKWAEDEVTKLKDAVLTHGGKNWKKIAALVPDRTIYQCCNKWKDMERNRSTVREKASGTLKKAPACVQDPHSP